jgi:DASS family divalent anion:Na+ symporter
MRSNQFLKCSSSFETGGDKMSQEVATSQKKDAPEQLPETQESTKPSFPKSEVNVKKLLIAMVCGVVLAIIPPPAGLTTQSMQYLGIFIFMIITMLIEAAQMWAITSFSALMCVVLKLARFNELYSEFSGSTIWMVLAVVGFAACMQESGIMKRIALNILKFFPPNFSGQVMALLTACTVVNPMVPSSTAKLAMMSPLAGSIISETGLKPHSKGARGLWFIMWMTIYIGAPLFLTGSNITIILLGMMPGNVSERFTWVNWFTAAAPWGISMLILAAAYVIIFLRPDEKVTITKETMQAHVKELGPMSSIEKFCLGVLIITVAMWVTVDYHGISTAITAWMALLAMYIRGLFTSRDVVAKLPWSVIMMFGPMMGVVALMKPLGIIDFVASILPAELIRGMIPNAFVFVVILAVFTFLLRFIVDQMSLIPIVLAIFGPIAAILDINIWIVLFVMWVNGQCWPLPHHGVMIMQTHAMMGHDLLELNDVRNMTYIYSLISLAACLIAVPFWIGMGLI